MERGKLPRFGRVLVFSSVFGFFSEYICIYTCIYKARDVFKGKCSSLSSGINLQKKLSINKVSPMGKIFACFQLLSLNLRMKFFLTVLVLLENRVFFH